MKRASDPQRSIASPKRPPVMFARGDYFMTGPDAFGPRRRIYNADVIAKRLGLDWRAINPDNGRPRKVVPRCECTHTVLEHRDDAHWSCRKCRCKGYGGDDV